MMRRKFKEFCHCHPEAYAIVHVFLFPPGLYSHLWLPPSPLPKSLPLMELERFSSHLADSSEWWERGGPQGQHYNVRFLLGNPISNSQIILFSIKRKTKPQTKMVAHFYN